MNRRHFIKTGVLGVAGLAFGKALAIQPSNLVFNGPSIEQVKLGNTGISIPRIGLGTGTVGYSNGSNQTRLGMNQFVKMAQHCYDQGIRYFDMAESYGSHKYVGNAIKNFPREDVILCTKIWTHPNDSKKIQPVEVALDRYRKDLETDYIDILLMHCLVDKGWTKSRSYYMDTLSEAKSKGILKSVGVSCHSWDALEEAVDSPWVDVILARINPFQSHMDGTPEAINGLLKRAKDNGKGIIGMKIFGEGKHIADTEREQSLNFAFKEANIHSMTIGLESIAQVDDLVSRAVRILKA
ncbi:aldo/keto reductase [Dysgonomonas sp. Marseille-P4677]|nr:aldo/keto reductase [Dysgonomonas sp. Marseille-P4677]